MTESQDRPRMFDDLAGLAGGAFSVFAGLRDEAGTMARARMDEFLRRMDLVRREEFEAVQEMASLARAGQERAEAALRTLEARVAALEARTGAGGRDEGDPPSAGHVHIPLR